MKGIIVLLVLVGLLFYVDQAIEPPIVDVPVENKTVVEPVKNESVVVDPVLNDSEQPRVDSMFELLEFDILDMMDKKQIDSSKVTVFGIKLGDSFADMFGRLGNPDFIDEFEAEGILNAKYVDEKTNASLVIYHFEDDVLEGIVIRKGLDDKLIGKSKINYTLDQIARTFGKPDFSEDTVAYRLYRYDDLGLELYHERKKLRAYGFVRHG